MLPRFKPDVWHGRSHTNYQINPNPRFRSDAPGGGGASVTAKTSGLGRYGKRPVEVIETARREAALKPRLRRSLCAA